MIPWFFSSLSRWSCAALLALAAREPGSARADPAAELSTLSVFKDVNLEKLAEGKPMMARGPAMSFSRGLAIESCYIVRSPLAKTVNAHVHWNPARRSGLKVFLHEEIPARPALDDFKQLGAAPANSAIKSFAAATQKLGSGATDLQMSAAEAKSFKPDAAGPAGSGLPPDVAAFWMHLLHQRATDFFSGGPGRMAPYETTGDTVRVAEEFARLLKEAPKVRSHFAGLIDATPLGGGKGSLTPSGYWELFDVEGQAAASLGAVYPRTAGDSAQMVDAHAYSSGGLFVLLSFYQMWPVKAGGRDTTLVWRADLISARQLEELRGVERMGSGSAMMRETQKAIEAFQRDATAK